MRRRQALAAVGTSAVGLAVTSGTAVTRPDYIGLQRGVAFTPELGSDDTGEATRVDTNASEAVVEARGAITYRGETQTTVEFARFDSTPDSVDVALYEFTRGPTTSTDNQTVSVLGEFQYSSAEELDDFFMDMIGDTLIE